MSRFWGMSALFAVSFFGMVGMASAAGTITGGFQGPEGQPVNATVRFLKGTTEVNTSTTNGRFSQALEAGEWSLTAQVAADAQFGAFQPLTIPRLKVDDGDSFDLGTMPVNFAIPSDADDNLEDFGSLPSQCTDAGGPIVIRTFFSDLSKGNFLYAGRSNGVTLIADQAGYTVTGDYSIYENNQPGTNTFNLTDNGDGSYTGSFTVTNTNMGGGLVILSVVGSGGARSGACTPPGPLNLDIRTMLTGSDTTNFAAVGDFRSIENFTMHVADVIKITMRKPVNMLDTNVQRFFKSIAKTFEHENGRMELNAAAAVQLQKAGAEVTFYNVPSQYTSTPEILLDGGAAGSAVSNIVYNASAKTLTFTAAHFSEYKLAPKVTFTSPTAGSSTASQTVTVTGTVNDLTASVRVHVNGIDAGSVVPNSSGQWAKTVTLTKSGSNTISALACNTSACSSSQSLSVTYSPTTTTAATSSTTTTTTTAASSSSSTSTTSSSTTLPKTGSSPVALATFLALIGIGSGLALAARRLRKERV